MGYSMTSIQVDRIDGLSSSTAVKGPCRVATTANISLTGQQTIDGVAVVADDRVLVKNQTDARDNGIWVADTGPWRRARDFANNRDVRKGTRVWVTDGDNGPAEYVVATDNPIVIGTTEISIVLADTQLVLTGVGTEFATKALAELYEPDTAPLFIRIQGYAAPGDGGGALYKKVDAEPDHVGKFSITLEDGVTEVWYEIADREVTLTAFGPAADGVTDDTAIFNDAASYASSVNGKLTILAGDYAISDAVLRSNMHLEFAPGARFLQGTLGTSASRVLYGTGTVGVGVTLSGDVALGAASVSVASGGTAFTAGSYALVYDDDYVFPSGPAGRNQEVVRVLSSTATTITLTKPLTTAFTTANSAKIAALTPLENLTISGD